MKPEGRMYQAAAKANVLNSEIIDIIEDEAVHIDRSQHYLYRKRRGKDSSIGVLVSGMIQDGSNVNLGEPLSSSRLEYAGTSLKKRERANDLVVVGLTDITQSMGKPYTWGSGQQWRAGFKTCLIDTQRLKQ